MYVRVCCTALDKFGQEKGTDSTVATFSSQDTTLRAGSVPSEREKLNTNVNPSGSRMPGRIPFYHLQTARSCALVPTRHAKRQAGMPRGACRITQCYAQKNATRSARGPVKATRRRCRCSPTPPAGERGDPASPKINPPVPRCSSGTIGSLA